jgi:hypothetical protein
MELHLDKNTIVPVISLHIHGNDSINKYKLIVRYLSYDNESISAQHKEKTSDFRWEK